MRYCRPRPPRCDGRHTERGRRESRSMTDQTLALPAAAAYEWFGHHQQLTYCCCCISGFLGLPFPCCEKVLGLRALRRWNTRIAIALVSLLNFANFLIVRILRARWRGWALFVWKFDLKWNSHKSKIFFQDIWPNNKNTLEIPRCLLTICFDHCPAWPERMIDLARKILWTNQEILCPDCRFPSWTEVEPVAFGKIFKKLNMWQSNTLQYLNISRPVQINIKRVLSFCYFLKVLKYLGRFPRLSDLRQNFVQIFPLWQKMLENSTQSQNLDPSEYQHICH